MRQFLTVAIWRFSLASIETLSHRCDMIPVLTMEAVHFARSGRHVLSAFDLKVESGRHTLLLGPSGSGKTTILNLAAGLLSAESGKIEIAGKPMPATAAARDSLRRANIGIIFQTLRLVSALTLFQNLELAARLSGRQTNDVRPLLATLGISHRADARPRNLSQGEAQRAAIARALVARPQLLLADEPTSALDDANTEAVAQLLLESAAAHGSTLVIATHDARLKRHIENVITLETA
jgi:putative ABC transport system ATP-binding protein